MTVELFPATLAVVSTVTGTEAGRAWWAGLPQLVKELREKWSLELSAPYPGGSCSWVAPVTLPDGGPAVLKINWPHREAAGEAEALRLWNGHGAVALLQHDQERHALLIEQCLPGDELGQASHISAPDRLMLAAQLLRELWDARIPGTADLEDLADVTAEWADLVDERMRVRRPAFDPGLVRQGSQLLRELPISAPRSVLLHGDFNPGNVLRSQRRAWLAIDAKPMIGDPAYDPWPLVEQIDDPFRHTDVRSVLADRFALVADTLGEQSQRLIAWSLARRVETALWLIAHDDPPGGTGVMDEAAILADLAAL